eukprot:6178333-Pleurochrysis_carterae.AAC.4
MCATYEHFSKVETNGDKSKRRTPSAQRLGARSGLLRCASLVAAPSPLCVEGLRPVTPVTHGGGVLNPDRLWRASSPSAPVKRARTSQGRS